MTTVFGFIMLAVSAILVLGWLAPLIIGARRWRRGAGGRALTCIGAGWCLLIAGLFGSAFWRYHTWQQTCHVDTFDTAAFTGASGTLSVPYDGKGSLRFEQTRADGTTRNWTVDVTNRCVRVPTGTLTANHLSLEVADAAGTLCGNLSVSFAASNATVQIATNEQSALAGGFPLTASVAASSNNGQISLSLSIVDTAGNDATWRAAGPNSKPPAFEAVASSGKCFWRDNFEYG